ncbi:hypothetical protein K7640_02830 [Micromonospora sp. PLK6-60]|uniref:hypothetical protein n=1 Tax=Micromonospora sp. PLK6-60 TaxID=2873383 RepID=UPI001CA7A723|nr:hypothetical protein [Micromonospora sp. PLK6-60]MBY8870777.1 hypothetical protein [Micromonospora sp. PLK6-60]
MTDRHLSGRPRLGRPTSGRMPAGGGQAVLRWKVGHQLFHLHLAAMNTLLVDARAALDARRWGALTDCLDQLRVLYDAATATMRYAADFSPATYEGLIRPSMAPPYLSPGFSGVLNSEHEQMLERFRALRRQLKQLQRAGDLPAAVGEAGARLWSAQSRNRKNHVLVCEKFVPEGRSLLKEYFQAQEDAADPAQRTARHEPREGGQ